MKVLDLFCGAGGAAVGYRMAGFEVDGVDINPQPHFPYALVRGDAIQALRMILEFGCKYDLVHASPPCQAFSVMRRGRWQDRQHPDLIGEVRWLLRKIGVPYVIENVMGAPLNSPVLLCGTMFGLETKHGSQLRRHRLFETSWGQLMPPGPCRHNKASAIGVYGGGQHPDRRRMPATIGVYGHSGGSSKRDGWGFFTTQDRRDAMGIDWMTGEELSQAIPPAYTQWIGEAFLRRPLGTVGPTYAP